MENLGQQVIYNNANEAFEKIMLNIKTYGEKSNDTIRLFNVGFYVKNPLDNTITNSVRNWKLDYAQKEWEWYMSKNDSVLELQEFAPIWKKMHSGDGIVNSNYGCRWSENNQLDKIIDILSKNPTTRRAYLSIYDGKNVDLYKYDTPCTLNIGFNVVSNSLNMNVIMRSNDIWFGYCNDQFCFSNLHKLVAEKLNIKVGWCYHFACDMHLYENKFKYLDSF